MNIIALVIVMVTVFISACTNSPKKSPHKKPIQQSSECKHFKLKNLGTGINLSQKNSLDFGMTGVNNKRFRTLQFYTTHPNLIATNIIGNIYEPPFSFGAAFPGIDPHYQGCGEQLPHGNKNIHKSCQINVEFRPQYSRHYMSVFVLNYFVNNNKCFLLVTLKGQGVDVY